MKPLFKKFTGLRALKGEIDANLLSNLFPLPESLSQLAELKLTVHVDFYIAFSNRACLPDSLKVLSLKIDGTFNLIPIASEDWTWLLGSLPPQLELTLDLFGKASEWYFDKFAPSVVQSLVEFSVGIEYAGTVFRFGPADSPRKLRKLTLVRMFPDSDDDDELQNMVACAAAFFKDLESLTELVLDTFDTHKLVEILPNLPRNVTKLTLREPQFSVLNLATIERILQSHQESQIQVVMEIKNYQGDFFRAFEQRTGSGETRLVVERQLWREQSFVKWKIGNFE